MKQRSKLSNSVSFLHLAERTKEIRNLVRVNEDPTDKLVRDLRQENEALRKKLARGSADSVLRAGLTDSGEIFLLIYMP